MKTRFFIFSALMVSLLIASAGCKKTIDDLTQQQQEDLVILAMTNGKWKMTWFKENNVNINDFDGYEFQYYSNYTVDATIGTDTKRGNWGGSSATMTTSCDFPPSAGNPLLKINGTWNIIRNSWTYVEAQQVSGGITKMMRLDKK
jgi:hypothetical protein